MVLPITMVTESVIESEVFVWIAEPIFKGEIEVINSSEVYAVWSFLPWIYFVCLSFFLARSSINLIILQKLKEQSEYVKKQWFKLFKTTQSRPFSFFSSVFIPQDIFGTNAFDKILAHECVHVRLLHSADRLLVDFFVALFWFNPFMYLYRRALIEVHEYQADAIVVKQYNDLVGYQEILYSQLTPSRYPGLVSHFNFSTIKKRIVMMNKSKNEKQTRFAYFFAMPLLALVMMAFTSKEVEESAKNITQKIERITTAPVPQETAVRVELAQEDQYKPSILPLKATAEFKVSSGYGMRNDPLSNGTKRKHHGGLDLAVPLGTVVVATADGMVEELGSDSKGYGNLLVLKHGDNYKTKYSQLSEFKVSNGERVKKGQVIALTGNSGRSTGPHLHYEVLENGKRKNPMDFIKNYKFSARLAPSVKSRNTSQTVAAVTPIASSESSPQVDTELAIKAEVETMVKVEAISAAIEAAEVEVETELETMVEVEALSVVVEAAEVEVRAALASEAAMVKRITAVEVSELAKVRAEIAVVEVEVVAEKREIAELSAKLAEVERELAESEQIRDRIESSLEKKEKTKEKAKNKEKDKAKLKNKPKKKN